MDINSEKRKAAANAENIFKEEPQEFMLANGGSFTVKRGAKYSKRSMLGGEGFKPTSAYVGKRGKIIYEFTPTFTTDFNHLEIDEDAVKSELIGFEEYVAPAFNEMFQKLQAEKAKLKSMEAVAANEEREKLYGADYGSW